MKKLFSLLIVLISIKCLGQVYQVLPQYGYEMKRVNATLVLLLPSDTVTNKTGVARIGTVLYSGNGTKWTPATATDTTSLSNRINLKIDSLTKSNDTIYQWKNNVRTFAFKDIGISAIGVTTANGVSGTSSGGSTPNLTLSLGAITPTSVVSSGTVTGSSLIKSGGTASQILAADGSVITAGDFITITGGQISSTSGASGGGSSVNYYLNGGTNQGTFGGSTYYEFSKTAVIGTGADFSIAANGYIASFITDAADPSLLKIPAGNWNLEFYFNSSSAGGSPSFYVELYKYDGTTFTSIASNSATPEGIDGGTAIDAYYTSLAVPETVLGINDRLAIRVYVNHSSKTITLHTQNGHLCEVLTTFTSGITALNGLQAQVQNFATGTSGTDFAISSTGSTHTFNLPTASAANRGALSSADWTAFNNKGSVSSVATDNATGITGGTITTTGTLAIDTIVISTRKWRQKGIDSVQANLITGLALKVNIADTASMLSTYFRKVDTASLSNRINLKLNISDTSSMLSPYARTNSVNAGLALKVNISDTSTMLTPYLRKIDTASLSNRINLKANINSPTFTGTVGGITQSMVGLGNVTNESKATMFTNATFTGTFATAAGAIGNASLANGAVANLSGTNTGDQTTITGNAATATALQTARTIGTTTGDATSAGSSFNGAANNTNALTLATVNTNVGSFGSATQSPTYTVNGKGLLTAAANVTITPAVGSISGLGTGVATALGVNTGSAGAVVLFNGNAGTPSALVGTNITGTASLNINGTVGATTATTGAFTTATINTSGQAKTISTFYGAGSAGDNIFIGGGGLSSGTGGGGSINGSQNTSVGGSSLLNLTTGHTNTAVGYFSLLSLTTGYENVGIGAYALGLSTTARENTATGWGALYTTTSGLQNSAFGNRALFKATSADANTAFGYGSLQENTTADKNSSFGTFGLILNTTGSNNTAIGYAAGYGVGTNANTTGSNNIFIGKESIGVGATESNRTWIGNSSTTSTWVGGSLLVGTTTDAASSILNLTSTTKGLLFPRMTTTQKNAITSPAAGLVVYDTTLNKLCVFTTVWETITSL